MSSHELGLGHVGEKCCLCGQIMLDWGNNPWPLGDLEKDEVCCDVCNWTKVIPARLRRFKPEAPKE